MTVTIRRLAALGLVAVLGFAAAPVVKIQFTDTKLITTLAKQQKDRVARKSG